MKLTVPEIGVEEFEAVQAVLESGHLTQGPVAKQFERAVADYVAVPFGVATSSCTTGLHLCLSALGVEAGQEVIVPDFTWPATANVVIQQGAIPVIVDVDPLTLTMDSDSLNDAITEKTAAIIPVHTFGVCADMDAISALASSIPVIEDAACALGSTYRGRPAGSLGTMAAFSFHPRKVITTGEGGMVTLKDRELEEKVRLLSSHGGLRTELFFEFIEAGFNYRMSDISAAIGLVQMTRLNSILDRRKRLAEYYKLILRENFYVITQTIPEYTESSYQSFVVLLQGQLNRDGIVRALRLRGIEATLGTYSLHNQPVFKERYGYVSGQLPSGNDVYKRSLTLPLFPSMTESDVEEVCQSLLECIMEVRKHRIDPPS